MHYTQMCESAEIQFSIYQLSNYQLSDEQIL